MAAPNRVRNITTGGMPPAPFVDKVRHWFYKGTTLMFVIDGVPNGTIDVPRLIGLGWVVAARPMSQGEFSVLEDSEEFDGDDAYPKSPTNVNIPGTTLVLEYDT